MIDSYLAEFIRLLQSPLVMGLAVTVIVFGFFLLRLRRLILQSRTGESWSHHAQESTLRVRLEPGQRGLVVHGNWTPARDDDDDETGFAASAARGR